MMKNDARPVVIESLIQCAGVTRVEADRLRLIQKYSQLNDTIPIMDRLFVASILWRMLS